MEVQLLWHISTGKSTTVSRIAQPRPTYPTQPRPRPERKQIFNSPPSRTPRRPARLSFFASHFPGCVFLTSFPVTNGLLTNENSQQQAPRKRTICAALVRTFSALLIQNSQNVWFSWRFGSVWPDSAVCMCGNSASCHWQLALRLLGHRWFYVF